MKIIALQYLETPIEKLEDVEEDLKGNVAYAKVKILIGWHQRNPEGNPRHVSKINLNVF